MTMKVRCVSGKLVFRVLWIMLLGLGSCALGVADHTKTVEAAEETLSISNGGLEWDSQFGLVRVWITGAEEQRIMGTEEPPLDLLLGSLGDPGKYKAAHVLLTYRYMEHKKSQRGTGWNGLEIGLGLKKESTQMKDIQNFWHDRLVRGKLEKPVPVLSKKRLEKIFNVPDPKEEREHAGKQAGFDRSFYDRLLAKNYESVPLEVIHGKYYVVCMINEQPVHFLLDTGGQSLILSTAKARELKLPLKDTGIQDGAIGGSFKRQMGSINSMGIGDLISINTDVIPVLPFQLAPGDDKRSRDGLLGLDILMQMSAILDFKNDRLLVRLPKSDMDYSAILKQSGYPADMAFDLEQVGPHQVMKSTIDGIPVKLVVDSGADTFTLSKAFCEKNKIQHAAAKDGNQALGAGGHALKVYYANCKALEIGGRINLTNFTTPVIDFSHVNGGEPGALNGTFGIDLLNQIGFLYDPVSKKLYLPLEMVSPAETQDDQEEGKQEERIQP